MSFRRWATAPLLALAITLVGTSCFLSDKKEEKKGYEARDIGCLDALGEKVTRFVDGKISESEWNETFDCVEDQIEFFGRNVRGNDPRGYNQADIQFLIKNYLIKTKTVTDQFTRSLFDLKAGVFGGDASVITAEDLKSFVRFARFLQKESLAALAPIRDHQAAPTAQTYLQLAKVTADFGDHVAEYLVPRVGTHSMSKDSFIPFAKELFWLTGRDLTKVDENEKLVRRIKVLIAGGSEDTIEAAAWPRVIQEGGAFGGLFLAAQGLEKIEFRRSVEKDEYTIELLRRARGFVNRVMRVNANAIDFERIYQIMDAVPSEYLDRQYRKALRNDFAMIIRRGIGSRAKNAVDDLTVKTLFDIAESGLLGQIWTKRIYENLPREGVHPERFAEEARRYLGLAATSADRNAIQELIAVSNDFRGLFPTEGNVMLFNRDMANYRTENHIVKFNWFRKAMRHVYSRYLTGTKQFATVEDLTRLCTDFGSVLKAFGKFAPDTPYHKIAEQRFQEANLFMPNSNGDEYVDAEEGVYYLATLFSAGNLTIRTWGKVFADGKNCPVAGSDELGKKAISIQCFRHNYFDRISEYLPFFPALVASFTEKSRGEQRDVISDFEIAGRKSGETERPIGEYDMDSMSAIPHYVESAFLRFDENGDDVLDRDEIIDGIFPVFRGALEAVPGAPKGELMLQGLMTYLIKYGKVPETVGDKAQFLWWVGRRWIGGQNAWYLEGTRYDIYRILSLLAEKAREMEN